MARRRGCAAGQRSEASAAAARTVPLPSGPPALGDALLQTLQPELKLIRAQRLGPTAKPVAHKALDQPPQLVVLSLAFLHGALQRHLPLGGCSDQVAQRLLKAR